MQPYQNYSMPQMNPYQQNSYNPSMFAAQQRLAQMEQMYPQFTQQNQFMQPTQISGASQASGIPGKMVSDFETVKATETPLDGSISYFPFVNGEYIYTKFLNMNTGSSDYAVYKRVADQQEEQKQEFDIKSYLDEKFETLKQELKGGARNARKPNSKPDNIEVDE